MLSGDKKTHYNLTTNGFALPTVLIASIVMIIVLLSSVTATVAVRTSLTDQYYNQLAKNAAEAGVAYARACINASKKDWGSLQPNIGCDGSLIQPEVSNYIYDGANFRTTFTVECDGYDNCSEIGATDSLVSTGSVQLLRGVDDVWREYSVNIRFTESGTVVF